MKAVVLREPGRLAPVELIDAAPPGPGEVLVRVRRIGICGTDLHAFHGRQPFFTYPRILGHELGVEVEAVGPDVVAVRAGVRAAVRPAFACGTCDTCRRGFDNACPTLTVLGAHVDGGMRERMVVPAASLHPSPTLTLDQLALVEPLSIGGHAVVRGAPVAADRTLVIGAGPIGLAIAAHLLATGVRPLVSDVNAARRDFAEAWAGVESVTPGADLPATIRDRMGGELPTLIFDATGNAASMHGTFDLVAHGGRVVFVGLHQGEVSFHDPDFHRRELTLHASRNATAADFERSIALIEAGGADVLAWVTDRTSLDDLPRAFPTWARPASRTIKALVEV